MVGGRLCGGSSSADARSSRRALSHTTADFGLPLHDESIAAGSSPPPEVCDARSELPSALLAQLGSVERVMTSDVVALAAVPGIGPERAARIREIVSG
jgi:hypothetical protein